tara:strand:+ start:3958 stop:4257 length:300 start_codon:yes stop_codon:yes gene_type:complete
MTYTYDEKRIQEIGFRLKDLITDYPWRTEEHHSTDAMVVRSCMPGKSQAILVCREDAPFIANAPSDVHYLLNLVKQMRSQIEEAEKIKSAWTTMNGLAK